MPDKWNKCSGAGCLRCWRNKLKHANPIVKKYMKKNGIKSIANLDRMDFKKNLDPEED